jgi:GNAT superfamily N-acetyltransferase
MKIKLSQPKPGDIGWIIAKHGEVYSRQFLLNSRFELDIARKVVSFFGNPTDFDTFILAKIDGRRAGSVAVSRQSATIAFVNFLLVLEAYRGRGVAQALMQKVIQHAKEYPFKRLRLETYSILADARRLYQKLGFTRYETIAHVEKYGRVFDQEFWELKL